MAQVAGHLSLDELQAGYRGSEDATLARHYQVIWLLAQGRTCAEVARLTGFAPRWVEQLLARYNGFGPVLARRPAARERRGADGADPGDAGDAAGTGEEPARRRRGLDGEEGGGVDGGRARARRVAEQRGWEALRAIGWTIQSPRPRHARGGDARGAGGVQKRMARPVCKLISSMLPFSLRQRIRHRSVAPRPDGASRVPVLTKLPASVAPYFEPGFQDAVRLSGHLGHHLQIFGPCALAPAVSEAQALRRRGRS